MELPLLVESISFYVELKCLNFFGRVDNGDNPSW